MNYKMFSHIAKTQKNYHTATQAHVQHDFLKENVRYLVGTGFLWF